MDKYLDVAKSDNLYQLAIPTYHHQGDSVYYDIVIKDLVRVQEYRCSFRFTDLKAIHEKISKLEV